MTGELGWGLGLAWSAGNWVVNGAYHDLGDPDILSVVKMRPGLIEQEVSPRVELGLGYGKPFGDRWVWITELSGDVMTESTGEYDRANLASGGRYRFGDDAELGVQLRPAARRRRQRPRRHLAHRRPGRHHLLQQRAPGHHRVAISQRPPPPPVAPPPPLGRSAGCTAAAGRSGHAQPHRA